MALPVSPAPKSRDVAVQGWAGITVRVAWTLLQQGVKVRPDVLADARAHALLCIAPSDPLPQAEDLAGQATRAFVARARAQRANDAWPQDVRMPLSPRWIRALERSVDPVTAVVFRKHYGDNRSLGRLEESLHVDRTALDAGRSGLREAIRRIGVADGLPFQEWANERLDNILARMAAYAPGPCPPPLDVTAGAHHEHVRSCPRCDRMVRLFRSGILRLEDVTPPTLGARPSGRVRVLALQLHPDARVHRKVLTAEIQRVRGSEQALRCYPIGDDLILTDAAHLPQVEAALRTACEVGSPPRELLRGAILDGVGLWSPHGLLGPLTDHIDRALQSRAWGHLDGASELPVALPPPPSARRAWLGVGALAAATLVALRLAWAATATAAPDGELRVAFADGPDLVWAQFDAPDPDPVAVVAWGPSGFDLLSAGQDAADKASLAVGDGSFRASTAGEGLLVIRHDSALAFADLLDAAASAQDPLERLHADLQARYPEADVRWHRR
jgi:hypothetical protein